MEDKKHKHHHHEEEHRHHHHHHPECPPIGNPDCEGHTKGERVLTESGLKAILQKLTGRLMLAVGVVKAKGDAPLKLWKDVDGDGILIRGMMTPVSESTDGWFSKEDYAKFLQALTDIEAIFQRLSNIDATLEGLAGSITSIRAELKEIQTHLTTLDREITAINTRIDELTTLVNNLDTRVTELNKLIEEVQNTLGDCVNKIDASGDDCLALSASKSGQTATVTGSVVSASTTQRGAMTATDKSRLDELWQKYQNGDFGCDCTHYTYGDISVSLSYSTASATATSLSPSMSYSQTVTGSDGSSTTLTSGATVVYSLSNAASGVTINTSTGVLSFSANTSTSQKTLGTVTVSVSMNEKTTSRSVTAYQAAADDTGDEPEPGEVTYEYSTPSVSLSYTKIPASGGTATPTCTYTQTRTGSDGSTATITSGGSLSYQITDRGHSDWEIDSSTGIVTKTSANTGSVEDHVGAVTVTVTLNGKTGTADCWIYQEAAGDTGGGTGEVTYEYSTPSVTLTYTDAGATAASTATPTCTYSQTRTGSDGSTTTITSGGSVTYSVGGVYLENMDYDSSTGIVTVNIANTSTVRRTVCIMTATVTLNGKSGSATATVYQAAAEASEVTYEYSTPSVSLSYDSPVGPSAQHATPNYSYSQVRTGSDGSSTTITSGGSLSFALQGGSYISGVSINSSTGVVEYPLNDTGSERLLCNVILSVTLNGKTGTGTAEIRQEEIQLPEICFVNLNAAAAELTDSSLISVQNYNGMAYKSGTAMTIGVSLPEGASGVYFYNIAIWFDAGWNSGNVGHSDPQYQCIYHTGQANSTGSGGSAGGALESIYHGGESGVSYGDGYYRLTISNATLALMSGSSEVELLELDLWHFYTDLIGGSNDTFVRANRYLRLRYTSTSVPTTLDEFIENIRVELIAQ